MKDLVGFGTLIIVLLISLVVAYHITTESSAKLIGKLFLFISVFVGCVFAIYAIMAIVGGIIWAFLWIGIAIREIFQWIIEALLIPFNWILPK